MVDRLKARDNMSIYEFLRVFGKIAPKVYAAENGNAELVVVPAYPDELLNLSGRTNANPAGNIPATITYQIVRREPATIQDHPFDPRKSIKPRIMEVVNEGGITGQVSGMFYDNLVQLDCWSTSNGDADDLIEWLENFMLGYTFYFKEYGIHEMYYFRGGRFTWGTTEEEAMVRWRNPFKVRSMTYYVRSEKLWWKDLKELDTIVAELGIIKLEGRLR